MAATKIIFTGRPGSGKTSALEAAKKELEAAGKEVVIFDDYQLLLNMFHEDMAKERFDRFLPAQSGPGFTVRDFDVLNEVLKQICDGIDQLSGDTIALVEFARPNLQIQFSSIGRFYNNSFVFFCEPDLETCIARRQKARRQRLGVKATKKAHAIDEAIMRGFYAPSQMEIMESAPSYDISVPKCRIKTTTNMGTLEEHLDTARRFINETALPQINALPPKAFIVAHDESELLQACRMGLEMRKQGWEVTIASPVIDQEGVITYANDNDLQLERQLLPDMGVKFVSLPGIMRTDHSTNGEMKITKNRKIIEEDTRWQKETSEALHTAIDDVHNPNAVIIMDGLFHGPASNVTLKAAVEAAHDCQAHIYSFLDGNTLDYPSSSLYGGSIDSVVNTLKEHRITLVCSPLLEEKSESVDLSGISLWPYGAYHPPLVVAKMTDAAQMPAANSETQVLPALLPLPASGEEEKGGEEAEAATAKRAASANIPTVTGNVKKIFIMAEDENELLSACNLCLKMRQQGWEVTIVSPVIDQDGVITYTDDKDPTMKRRILPESGVQFLPLPGFYDKYTGHTKYKLRLEYDEDWQNETAAAIHEAIHKQGPDAVVMMNGLFHGPGSNIGLKAAVEAAHDCQAHIYSVVRGYQENSYGGSVESVVKACEEHHITLLGYPFYNPTRVVERISGDTVAPAPLLEDKHFPAFPIPASLPAPDVVIWDFDGIIANTGSIEESVLSKAYATTTDYLKATYGEPVTEWSFQDRIRFSALEQKGALFSKKDWVPHHPVQQFFAMYANYDEEKREEIALDGRNKLHEEYIRIFEEQAKAGQVTINPEIIEAMKTCLKKGIPQGVCSSMLQEELMFAVNWCLEEAQRKGVLDSQELGVLHDHLGIFSTMTSPRAYMPYVSNSSYSKSYRLDTVSWKDTLSLMADNAGYQAPIQHFDRAVSQIAGGKPNPTIWMVDDSWAVLSDFDYSSNKDIHLILINSKAVDPDSLQRVKASGVFGAPADFLESFNERLEGIADKPLSVALQSSLPDLPMDISTSEKLPTFLDDSAPPSREHHRHARRHTSRSDDNPGITR